MPFAHLTYFHFELCSCDFRQELSETKRAQRKRQHTAQRHFELQQYGDEEPEWQCGHQSDVRFQREDIDHKRLAENIQRRIKDTPVSF